MKKFIENLTLSFNKYFFPFYKTNDIKLLFKNLEEGESKDKEVAMFVGGCVRNYLLSKKIDDIDIATIFTPSEIKKKLQNTKFKIVDTGLDHSSVTVVSEHISELLTNSVRSVDSVADPLLFKSGKLKLTPQPYLSNSPYPVVK